MKVSNECDIILCSHRVLCYVISVVGAGVGALKSFSSGETEKSNRAGTQNGEQRNEMENRCDAEQEVVNRKEELH